MRELPLSPDFAAKVLAQADATIARRRRYAAVAVAAFAVATTLAPAVLLRLDLAPSAPAQSAQVVRSDSRWAPSPADKYDADAMTYLFPDVSPLVQFDQSYSATMSGVGVDDQTGAEQDTQEKWL